MADPVNFYPTSFCLLTLNDINLNHLQVGNIGYQYEIHNKPVKDDILLFVNVDGEVDIEIVVENVPLPPTADRRIIGGVLKHEDFVRTGTKQKRIGRTFRTVGIFQLAGSDYEQPEEFDDVITDW